MAESIKAAIEKNTELNTKYTVEIKSFRDIVLTQRVGSPTASSVETKIAGNGKMDLHSTELGVTAIAGVTENVAITITGAATSAGELEVTAGDKTYTVRVAVGDSATTVANELNAQIGQDAPTGFESTVANGVVTLTSTTPNKDVEDLVVTIK